MKLTISIALLVVHTTAWAQMQPTSLMHTGIKNSAVNSVKSPSTQQVSPAITPSPAQQPSNRPSVGTPSQTAAPATVVAAPRMTRAVQLRSYREWKTDKIQEAILKVATTKTQIEVRRLSQSIHSKTEAVATADMSTTQMENQLKADLTALEVAKDLTVTDYFVGYMSKIPDKVESIKEIAAKMKSDEVAELMLAYASSIFGSTATDIPKNANSSSYSSKDMLK